MLELRDWDDTKMRLAELIRSETRSLLHRQPALRGMHEYENYLRMGRDVLKELEN